MKKLILFAIMGLFCIPSVKAVSVEQVSAALEKADVKARLVSEEKYKGFNPHLTKEQQDAVPALVKGVLQRMQDAGYESLTEADITTALQLHFETLNFLSGHYTSHDMEVYTGKKIAATDGDLHQHAIIYALSKIMPPQACPADYADMKFAPVSDWKDFHYLCQEYMQSSYLLLTRMQDCPWEELKEVMCNIM